jgi:hypothetical protein
MKQLIALIMIAFLVPTTAAMAKSPCKEDKDKFCKDAKASGKKVSDCLKEHSAELAPACKELLAEKKAKKDEAKPGEGKPAEAKPAETKPAEPAPSESKPSEPASPGAAESKP